MYLDFMFKCLEYNEHLHVCMLHYMCKHLEGGGEEGEEGEEEGEDCLFEFNVSLSQ